VEVAVFVAGEKGSEKRLSFRGLTAGERSRHKGLSDLQAALARRSGLRGPSLVLSRGVLVPEKLPSLYEERDFASPGFVEYVRLVFAPGSGRR
jgi:hypothetical protein